MALTKKYIMLALALAAALVLSGCTAPADIAGDYEAAAVVEGFPSHMLLAQGADAYLDGEAGSWSADERGRLTLTLPEGSRRYTWRREGFWLIVRDEDGQECHYADAASFVSDESAEALAGWWIDDLGMLILRLDAGGEGVLSEVDISTQTALKWQAREGVLRFEYADPEGTTFEYLRFDTPESGMLRFCAYPQSPDGDSSVVMRAPDPGASLQGAYRAIGAGADGALEARSMVLTPEGGLLLDDRQGEWIHFAGGVTVVMVDGAYTPVLLADQGETLLMLETYSGASLLWAREDTFAASPDAAAALTGIWAGDDCALTLHPDGSISLDGQGGAVRGAASVSESLIRIENRETVEYICYSLEEEGVRIGRGSAALREPDTWPLLTPQR
ncbi:MAG: hypothetical protein ACOX7W_09340 [Christensenellales bacterium]|jgi:hypothetical protein